MFPNHHKNNFLWHDVVIIVFSVLVAITLVEAKAFEAVLTSTREIKILGSFIAGLFFTSVFTTAPAIVALGEIARVNSILLVAIFGAIGAVLGDLLIFRFVRDRLSEHLLELLQHQGTRKRISTLFRKKSFRWLTFFAGGLIIASPLPDELGISLLGVSHTKTKFFLVLSLTFNFLGIVLIGLVARAV